MSQIEVVILGQGLKKSYKTYLTGPNMTTHENASIYENLLKTEVFPSIEDKDIKGYKKISLKIMKCHMYRPKPGQFFQDMMKRLSIMRLSTR